MHDHTARQGSQCRRSDLAVPLLTAAEMREWDERAIQEVGIPQRVLMENAGRAAAAVVHQLYPEGRVVAAVGSGNNGGDAMVMLRVLRGWGRAVLAISPGDLPPAALRHGWDVPTADTGDARHLFATAGVIVDGLLGTGSSGAPRKPHAEIIRAIHASGRPIVALDGPSGIDFTTGATPGEAVRAEVTVSFGAPKRGQLLRPARSHVGRLVVAEIGFPPGPQTGEAAVVNAGWAAAHLPSIPWDAHKGTAGKVLVAAGSGGMGGAAVLVGVGALRAGAGVTRIVSPADHRLLIQTTIPEALFVPREDEGLARFAADADAIVAGPAIGTDAAAADLLNLLIRESDCPLVLDADATTLISRNPELLDADSAGRALLTPHPKEMARLLDRAIDTVLEDPFGAAREASERFGCAVLLKGSPSMVASPAGRTLVNLTGNSGIATGGMGDTLAGIAGAFLAAGAEPQDAGALALYYSGRAAELAGRGRGLLPRDIAEWLPAALVEEGQPSELGPGILLDIPAPT